MQIQVFVTDETESGFELDFFEKIADLTCMTAGARFDEAEVSVLLTDDGQIHDLNREYRDIDRPTDVLSFTMCEDGLEEGGMLGDVVISMDTAKKQAAEREITLKRETAFLYIHGILHLLGFDHEISEEEETKMFDLQEKILKIAIETGIVD